jgi:hypothetical protein
MLDHPNNHAVIQSGHTRYESIEARLLDIIDTAANGD